MARIKGVGDFFALDIGTNAIRVAQLARSGADGWSLQHFGYAPVDSKITAADSAESNKRLAEVIMTAIGQSGIKTKSVVVGLPSQKTFTTVIDLPTMAEAELRGTIKYQIDKYIPMAADEAKVDWVLLGQSMHDQSQQEVLLTSVSNDYAESRLEFIEGLGFDVIGAEPDPIAMIRSLLPAGVTDARVIVDMGMQSSDIAITYGDAPRLVRTVPVGLDTLVRAAVQNLDVQEDQAKQFILKFGLAPDRLEGQVLKAIEPSLGNFTSELIKSIKFFQTRYPSIAVGGIMLSGYAGIVPLFTDYVASKVGVATTNANPWQKVQVSQANQQQLAPVSSEFATVIGLAQRSNRI